MQPVDLALALQDLRLAIPREVVQLTDRLRRHQARLQQPHLGELAQPRGVRDVGRAARDLLDVPRVHEQTLELVLQDRPRRLPIDARRLHHHLPDPVRGQPVTQSQQTADGRGELRDVPLAPPARGRDAHARGHLRLLDVQRRERSTIVSTSPLSIDQRHEPLPTGLKNRRIWQACSQHDAGTPIVRHFR